MLFADILGTGVEQPPEQPGVVPPAQVQAQVPPEAAPAGGGFMDKLKNDQAFAQAAIMMGARLMQGPRAGQDVIGAFGDAAMIGTQAYAFGKQNELENQRAGEKARVQNAQTEAQTAGTQADTQAKVLTNAENVQTSRDRVKALRLKAQSLERAGKLEESRFILDKAKAEYMAAKVGDPNSTDMEKLWEEELQRPVEDAKSKRKLQGAQALYYEGAAEHQGAAADLAKAQKENPEKFSKSGPSATVQNRKDIEARILEANPGISKQELHQKVIEFETTAKHKATADAFSAFVANGGYDLSTAAGAQKAEVAFQNHQKIVGRLTGGGAAPTPASGTPPAAPAQALPKSKDDMVAGQLYLVGGKPRKWNGKTFD